MNVYLLPSIEAGPLVIERLLSHLPESQWDVALDPDRFTLREVIAHLADWEPIIRGRIETALHSPGASIEGWDEEQMAIDHGYAHLDPVAQAALFKQERKLTADLIRGLLSEAWTQSVLHPERGVQTIEDMANLLLGHDLYHIEQLTGYLS